MPQFAVGFFFFFFGFLSPLPMGLSRSILLPCILLAYISCGFTDGNKEFWTKLGTKGSLELNTSRAFCGEV